MTAATMNHIHSLRTAVDNKADRHEVDSMREQLRAAERRIKELEERLNELVKR